MGRVPLVPNHQVKRFFPIADEAADVGVLRRQRLDRLALAAAGVGEIVDKDRAGDLHFDRPGEGS